MKKIWVIPLILIFFSFKSHSAIESKILLKVEKKIITNFELKNKILSSLILNNQDINQKNIDYLKKQTIDLLILIKLKEIEIEKYDLKINDNDLIKRLNDYLNKISSNNINRLKETFKNNGVDFEIFKKEVKTELMWQNLIYNIYSNQIFIDEESINLEVEKLINKKESIKEFRLFEIEILINNDKNDKKKIEDIEKQIENFGFENTAAKLSISSSASEKGDLGWINANSLSDEIYAIIKKMKIGEYSKPIFKTNSVLFLMIKDKKDSKSKSINRNKLKNQIMNRKKNELFNLYSQSHLSKIKNSSLIEY